MRTWTFSEAMEWLYQEKYPNIDNFEEFNLKGHKYLSFKQTIHSSKFFDRIRFAPKDVMGIRFKYGFVKRKSEVYAVLFRKRENA